MNGVILYLFVWIVFLFLIILFFFIKFIIDFIKLNGIKSIFSNMLKKENRLFILTIIAFVFVFWFAYFLIYLNNIYPYVNLTMKRPVYSDSKENIDKSMVAYETLTIDDYRNSKFEKIFDKKHLEIIEYKQKYIKIKFNTIMELQKCKNCTITFSNANQEYKLKLNEEIYCATLDKKTTYLIKFE